MNAAISCRPLSPLSDRIALIAFWVLAVTALSVALVLPHLPQTRLPPLLLLGLVFVMLGIGLRLVLDRCVTRPMQAMVGTAQAILAGDMSCRFDDRRSDEFGYLAGFINEALGKLSFQASHDALTGLYNRREFERVLRHSLEQARRDRQQHALCYVDLDQFKLVNDTCGHAAGDQLLKQVSAQLTSRLRKSDMIARLGGDEFGVLFRFCSPEDAAALARELLKAVSDLRFEWNGRVFRIGTSIGLVTIDEHSNDITEALSSADIACYAAKESGRNAVYQFDRDDSHLHRRRDEMKLATQIHEALAADRFCLFGQHIVRVGRTARRGTFMEVLLRLRDGNGGFHTPDTFIPAAERYQVMAAIDRWVVGKAIEYLEAHRTTECPVMLSVNLSGQSLSDPGFREDIVGILRSHPGCVQYLCFEITETTAITSLEAVTPFMRTLRDMGCCFALDDFGSGMCSFTYLKNLPVDFLKIDGTFVRAVADSRMDRSMVCMINEVGHSMGIETVAEFAENAAIVRVLHELGVDYAQGTALGRPAPLDTLLSMRAQHKLF